MLVLKFGGTSMGSVDAIQHVGRILKDYYIQGKQVAVVVSAISKVTDMLLEVGAVAASGETDFTVCFEQLVARHRNIIDGLFTDKGRAALVQQEIDERFKALETVLSGIAVIQEVSPRMKDAIISYGERNSAFILANYLQQEGVPAVFCDARKLIVTDDRHGHAKVDFIATNHNIQQAIETYIGIPIITGFIGASSSGVTTTLGRGGSDYSASIFGAALDAEGVEIWTDVDGVLTADPRKVSHARHLKNVTYAEALEMSHFGAKVIYPPTIQPLLQLDIPIYIKNTFYPDGEGTKIWNQRAPSQYPVTGISSINDIVLVTISGSGLIGVPGSAGRLFTALAQQEVNVILITQASSEHSISFAIHPQDVERANEALKSAFELEISRGWIDPIKVEYHKSIVAIIGQDMKSRPGIAGTIFQALGRNGINISAIAQGSSELNVSIVIDQRDEVKALNAIHETIFTDDVRVLNIFMVGVGLIGKTLLKQIASTAEDLADRNHFKINIVGLTDSKFMAIDVAGIPTELPKETLKNIGIPVQLTDFVHRMVELNLPNTIFIDNTASEAVPPYYETILQSSISIITPNKLATSGAYPIYQRLKALAKLRDVPFLYETNVGAGLPVITTIQDLLNSGDTIMKIEGVLSGSLSYIFNTYSGKESFQTIVADARDKGYTEPDPRIDLTGKDVRRKVVILAREIGLGIEQHEVDIEDYLPLVCRKAEDKESFMKSLESEEPYFKKLLAQADEKSCKIRLIATITKEKAQISLQAVDSSNPFYNLSGSDNMIVLTTARYHERPLVIRGPGAGSDVTAAGVYAEIIKSGQYIL